MSGRHTIGLVLRRELEARRRAALITLAALVTVAAGIMIAIGAFSGDGGARVTGEDADKIVATLGVIALFLSILLTGSVVLTGVAEEKNSRVVEVVLGTMRPRHLLAGKVLAMGLLGLGEIVITGAVILVVGEAAGSFEIPAATGPAILIVVAWFVLGYAFYSNVYAAAGALVRRNDNANNAAGPINVFVSIGYGIGVISAGAGENPVLRVASLFPTTAPFTMPVRMVQGTAPVWEIVLSALLVALGALGLLRLAGRVYAGGLLRTGKVSWRDAWRAAGELQ